VRLNGDRYEVLRKMPTNNTNSSLVPTSAFGKIKNIDSRMGLCSTFTGIHFRGDLPYFLAYKLLSV